MRSRKKIGLGVAGIALALAGAASVARLGDADVARADAPPPVDHAAEPAREAGAQRSGRGRRGEARPSEGRAVLRAAWGGAEGELGRRGGHESSPEGPMSFVVDAAGRAVVLDQVNSRVQVFEGGRVSRVVPLPSDTYQDVDVREGGLVALDRFGETPNVTFVDDAGDVTHQVPIVGPGVAEGGDVTALAQRGDGTWVEVGHQEWVRVADADGAPDAERAVLQGRPAPDGSVLRLARAGGAKASLVRLGSRGALAVTWLEFDLPIWALNGLETDAAGRVFVGAELALESDEPPFEAVERMQQVLVLDRSGAEIRRFTLPPSTGAEETFRAMRVGPDGALYQLVSSEMGVTVWRYEP